MAEQSELGPLAPLLGIWEGDAGTDVAPSDEEATDRQIKSSPYRERMVFEETGRVDNHEQILFGLRYRTTAWRIGADAPFHEEVGYWMWDASSQLVIRTFMPPRGMAILAGGTAAPDAQEFHLEATAGDEVFGICSSPFLTREFKTVRYTLAVDTRTPNQLTYEQHTFLKMKDREELFDHSDRNTLHRCS